MFSRAVAVVTALALAGPLAGAEGVAPRATPVRHRIVSQPLTRVKASTAGRRAEQRPGAHLAPRKAVKNAAADRSRTTTSRGHAELKSAARSHSTTRRRGRAEREEAAAPPTIHTARTSRRQRSEMPSLAKSHVENRTIVAASAPTKNLSSDDFLQAASGIGDADPDAVTAAPVGARIVADARTLPLAKVQPEAKIGPDPDPVIPGDVPISSRLDALNHPSREELADEAMQPVFLPGLYRNGRLVVPAPLKGSREVLVHQNLMADNEGLERIQNDDDLNRLRAAHLLVNFPESASLHVNPDLSSDRRCARVWTVKFASDVARQFYARFHEPLQVNSAARTIAYQVKLQRVNGNAAGIGGDVASPHLTGQAIDLGKRGMSMAEIAWMRAYLKPMMDAGKLDVEEEFRQACFHISVYRSYLPAMPARRRSAEVAQLR